MTIDRDRILAAAQKYVEKKRYDRAAIEYQRILQEDPSDARVLLKLGDVQSKMEAYADAAATYERVGNFYARQGFALKAIAVFKQVREIIAKHVPQLEDQYTHLAPRLAELYQQLGLTSDALAALDEVATRLQRQNRDRDAIEVFRKLVELDPTNPLPHLRLAEALSRARDLDGAVSEFSTAAGQLIKLERRDDALKVIERLLHHRADAAHARIAAELYLARSGTTDGMQALSKLQICFQANPRDLDTLGLLARAFTQIGQAAKAIEVQKEMVRIARDAGQLDVAREIVTHLVRLAPKDEGIQQLAQHLEGQSVEPSTDGTEEPGVVEPDDEVVTDSSIELVDDTESTTATGMGDEVARFLAEASAHRRARATDRAIDALRRGLRMAPRSLEVHGMLRDVLLETGRIDAAVVEMIAIAELLVEALDGEGAARSLQDALAIDPSNAAAARMLSDLGYELIEEAEPISATVPDATLEPAPIRGRSPSGNADGPLPSYDLEEIGPDDVAFRAQFDSRTDVNAPRASAPIAAAARASMAEIDDPFADQPLPSFPLEGAAEADRASEDRATRGQDRLAERASPAALRGMPELEEALEEAEFFASRGLFDDARGVLEEQLSRLPDHPLLRDRLTELDVQERSLRGGSGTRPSPAAAAVEDAAIAESLNSLEMQEAGSSGGLRGPNEQVDVEEVFAQFKAGVASQIGADDAQSHYDLGVAYKEMGLLDDAIRELEAASRDPKRSCVCDSMIGTIEIERGNLNEAIAAFSRGLQSPQRSRDQEAALSFELGAAYEAKKLNKQALEHFQRTARIAPNFRDVQERVRRLQKSESKHPVRAAAVGADDEFDRAFNDILEDDKPS